MQLNTSAIELVTAAMNIPLAVTSLIAVVLLWRRRSAHPLKAWLWIGVFGSLTSAACLGVIVHGLALDSEAIKLVWLPLYAALALTVACFAAGAVLDRWGTRAAHWTLPGWLFLSADFFLYTAFLSDSFLPFVIYEGACGHDLLSGSLRDIGFSRPACRSSVDGGQRGHHDSCGCGPGRRPGTLYSVRGV